MEMFVSLGAFGEAVVSQFNSLDQPAIPTRLDRRERDEKVIAIDEARSAEENSIQVPAPESFGFFRRLPMRHVTTGDNGHDQAEAYHAYARQTRQIKHSPSNRN